MYGNPHMSILDLENMLRIRSIHVTSITAQTLRHPRTSKAATKGYATPAMHLV